jgi:AraC-like DNA-binding protein
VGALVVNAPTVGAALMTLGRCYRWIQENSSLRFSVHGRLGVLEYQICDARIVHKHQDAELTIAAFCGLLRSILGPAWRPLETHFEHGPAGRRSEYRRVFSDSMSFDQATNAIVIDARLLDQPIARPNARVFADVHALVTHQLAVRDQEAPARRDRDGTLGLLEHVIAHQCKAGDVSIAAVARRAGRSIYGLRRDLRDCDAPFDELLLSVRQRAALRYVEQSDRDLTTIASLLGYSELSAFSRAFRRWHGKSPTQARAVARGVSGEPRRSPERDTPRDEDRD